MRCEELKKTKLYPDRDMSDNKIDNNHAKTIGTRKKSSWRMNQWGLIDVCIQQCAKIPVDQKPFHFKNQSSSGDYDCELS